MAQITPLYNGIMFQFEDQLVLKDGNQKKQFKDKTDWGFQYSTTDDSYDNSRWGYVTSVGPDVKDLYVGDRVMVTALKWTTAINFENEDYWKTDEDQILGYDPEVRETLMKNYIGHVDDLKGAALLRAVSQ